MDLYTISLKKTIPRAGTVLAETTNHYYRYLLLTGTDLVFLG
jgi:hypothetical protein